jgi:orotidine-5'-phosphate decarboxylase
VSPGFDQRLADQVAKANSLLCIGLDPDPARFPPHLHGLDAGQAIVEFNRAIVEATEDLVCAYKPNLGFYVAQGVAGVEALVETRKLIPSHIPVILDCKVGDMSSTAAAYAAGYFGAWNFDAVTANPYQGEDSLAPFLSYPDKGVFILCRTSNPSSRDLQDIAIQDGEEHLYLRVANRARTLQQNDPAHVGLVCGATVPEILGRIRAQEPALPILLPGVGAQDGDLEASLEAGLRGDGSGLLVAPSRSIIYAGNGPDFAERARDAADALLQQINNVRERRTKSAGLA